MRHPPDETTSPLPREELAVLLDTMTPHEQQRVTAEMDALAVTNEHEHEAGGPTTRTLATIRSLDAYTAHRRAERPAAHPGLVAAIIAGALLAFLSLMVLLPIWIRPPR